MIGTNGRGRMCVFPVMGSPSLDCQETTDDPQAKGASTAQQQARERGTGLAATQCRRGLRGPYQSVASVSMGKAAKSIRRRRGSRFGGGGSDREFEIMSLRSLGYLLTRRRKIYRVQAESSLGIVSQAASVSAAGRPGRSLHTLVSLLSHKTSDRLQISDRKFLPQLRSCF